MAAALRASYDIYIELATHATLVLVLGLGQPVDALERLAHDLAETVRRISRAGEQAAVSRPPAALEHETVIAPRDAFLGASEAVPVGGRGRADLLRVDRRLSAGRAGAPAGRAGHRGGGRLPARDHRCRRAPARRRRPDVHHRPGAGAMSALADVVATALAEDVGAGDLTTETTVPERGPGAGADHAEGPGRDLRSRRRRADVPRARPGSGDRAADRGRPLARGRPGAGARRLGAGDPDRRADRAQLPPAPVRRGHAGRSLRAGRRRARARRSSTRARPRRACARSRRRRSPPAAPATTASGSTTRS